MNTLRFSNTLFAICSMQLQYLIPGSDQEWIRGGDPWAKNVVGAPYPVTMSHNVWLNEGGHTHRC